MLSQQRLVVYVGAATADTAQVQAELRELTAPTATAPAQTQGAMSVMGTTAKLGLCCPCEQPAGLSAASFHLVIMPTVLLSGTRFFLLPPGSPLLQGLGGAAGEWGEEISRWKKQTQAYPSKMQATGWDVPCTPPQFLPEGAMVLRFAGKACVSCVSKKNELPQKLLEPIRRAHKAQSLQEVCLSLPWFLNLAKIHLASPRAVDGEPTHPVCRV